MDKEELRHLIDGAAGRTAADLVLRNAAIVDVYQAETFVADVAIIDGKIAGIGSGYQGKKERDLTGKYLVPGLIDAHIHVESSYVTPEEFGRLLTPHGTTTVLADPHEIVNVAGFVGLDYMIEAAKQTALDIQYMMPSCVPATSMENSGAVILAADMEASFADHSVAGLAEFMDFPGVIQAQDTVLDKLVAAHKFGKRVDGHSPQVTGKELNAYIAAGIKNDHECSTVDEMRERLQRGMYVFLREGSVTQNLRTLVKGVTRHNSRRCVLVADDLQARKILSAGHLDNSIRICIEEGLDPITAIQMATINAAECCELKDRGAIAPGLRADFVIVDDLQDFQVAETYSNGQLIAKDGKYLLPIKRVSAKAVADSVHIKDFSQARLALPLSSAKARAIGMIEQEILTTEAIISVLRNAEGQYLNNPQDTVSKLAVVERHHKTGNVAVGLLKDYGIKKGAICISIAHDSHNLIVTGTNDADMALAVTTVAEIGGGAALVKDGQVLATLRLAVGGLMSERAAEEVIKEHDLFNEIAHQKLGISAAFDPIMSLSFMSLEVIPALKLTDLGLVDVTRFEFVPVEVAE